MVEHAPALPTGLTLAEFGLRGLNAYRENRVRIEGRGKGPFYYKEGKEIIYRTSARVSEWEVVQIYIHAYSRIASCEYYTFVKKRLHPDDVGSISASIAKLFVAVPGTPACHACVCGGERGHEVVGQPNRDRVIRECLRHDRMPRTTHQGNTEHLFTNMKKKDKHSTARD